MQARIKENGLKVETLRPFTLKFWRLPTLPVSYPTSTIGDEGLNYSVRNGKRCDTLAIVAMNNRTYSLQYRIVFLRSSPEALCENKINVKSHDLLVHLD